MTPKKIDDLPELEKIKQVVKEEEENANKALEHQATEKKGKKAVRVVILSLLLTIVVLGGIVLFQSARSNRYEGTGSVSGHVVNAENTPIPAEVYILNSSYSTVADNTGTFQLLNIPAGPADVIVAWQGQGVEVPVIIQPDADVSIGELTIESTKMPGE